MLEFQTRIKFEWPVYRKYRLEKPSPGDEYMEPSFGGYKIVPDSDKFDWREPLTIDPSLCERFASLYENPSADRFLDFAESFGTLEQPDENNIYPDLGHWWMLAADFHSWVTGSWQAENELAEAKRSRIEKSGKTVLSTVVDKDGRTWNYTGPAKPGLNSEDFAYLRSPDRKLGILMGDLTPLLDYEEETDNIRWAFFPKSLASAMATQLVRQFGPKFWKKCRNCSTPFRVGPGTGNRRNKIYCDAPCRYSARDKKNKKT